jgi:Icc protein
VVADAPADGPALRLLHITDTHLFADARGELRGVVTWESLLAVLGHYRDSGWSADAVIASGDLVQDDSAAAYDRFRHALITLELPVLCVPGNHDVDVLMRQTCADPPFRYCAITEHDDWLLAGIDSCMSGETGGRVDEAEFARLHRALEDSAAGNALVYLHHPPVALDSTWLDGVGLANAAESLVEFARTGRVRLVIFGHAHQAYDAVHNGIRVLGTPSTCRQFRPGADRFALDDRPPAYRRLELGADGSFSTELVWVDAA